MRAISDTGEFDGLVRSSPAALVDFFATWCGPCVRIAPVLDALAKEHPQVEFVKVDVDEAQDIAQAQGIRAMPTFGLFKGGAEVGMVRGADEAALRDLLRQHAGDKWSGMSGGQALGSGAADAGMSDREKRLAALERRGSAAAAVRTGAGAGTRRRAGAAGRTAADVRRRGGREPRVHLGPGLAPPRRRAQPRGERTSGGGDDEDEAPPRRSPRRCKRRRRGRPAPSRRRPEVRGATRAAQGDGLHRRDGVHARARRGGRRRRHRDGSARGLKNIEI